MAKSKRCAEKEAFWRLVLEEFQQSGLYIDRRKRATHPLGAGTLTVISALRATSRYVL